MAEGHSLLKKFERRWNLPDPDDLLAKIIGDRTLLDPISDDEFYGLPSVT
jgi:hypothetical protein